MTLGGSAAISQNIVECLLTFRGWQRHLVVGESCDGPFAVVVVEPQLTSHPRQPGCRDFDPRHGEGGKSGIRRATVRRQILNDPLRPCL
jgi:hypothetical protein